MMEDESRWYTAATIDDATDSVYVPAHSVLTGDLVHAANAGGRSTPFLIESVEGPVVDAAHLVEYMHLNHSKGTLRYRPYSILLVTPRLMDSERSVDELRLLCTQP